MSKDKVMDINIDDIDIEAVELVKDVKVVKDDKSKAKPKAVVNAIKNSAPQFPVWDNMTAIEIDNVFQIGDQGRTIRRYLRKYFSDNHIHKDSWKLSIKEANEVIGFLTTKLDIKPIFPAK